MPTAASWTERTGRAVRRRRAPRSTSGPRTGPPPARLRRSALAVFVGLTARGRDRAGVRRRRRHAASGHALDASSCPADRDGRLHAPGDRLGVASGGGRELLAREHGVAYPVSPTTDHLGALLLAPLNIAWLLQAWLAARRHGVRRRAPASLLPALARHAALDRRRHRARPGRGLDRRGHPPRTARHRASSAPSAVRAGRGRGRCSS